VDSRKIPVNMGTVKIGPMGRKPVIMFKISANSIPSTTIHHRRGL
jgi:hypothetical protein